MYGKGVYFAVEARYSAGSYTKADAEGRRYMYLSRVLTGAYTKGNEDLIEPPPKDPATPNIKYDSVTDDTVRPNMFVVFTDTQAYPEYLVIFSM